MSLCKICVQDLTVELGPEDFDEASSSVVGESTTVPDDLLLQCGCHFHFQCLLDESPGIALSLACPACENSIVTGPSEDFPNPRVLTRYLNEGGLQSSLDILSLITEEAFLAANPNARPARAFMTLCSEGEISGMVELIQAIQEDPDEGDMQPFELLRWRDPLDEEKTGLHLAVEKGQIEAVLLLLWLGSTLPNQAFPEEFLHGAGRLGVGRELASIGEDVRALRCENGRTATDVARGMGSTWQGLIQGGLL